MTDKTMKIVDTEKFGEVLTQQVYNKMMPSTNLIALQYNNLVIQMDLLKAKMDLILTKLEKQ